MKKLMSLGLMVGLMALVPSAVMAETHISTNVDVPSTWYAAGSPYIVDNTISVNSDLTIEPGVTVQMNANIVLYVNGTLNAAGTAVSPIVFTGTTQSPNWWNSICKYSVNYV